MNKFIVTIDCKSNNKIYFHANNVQRFERYSVIVDENPVTFEYPVIGIEQVPYITEYQKKRYVLYFGDNNSRVIECVNGRFNPNDPYTFLHDNDVLEFEKPITKVETLAITDASQKHLKDAHERRTENNCPVQGINIKLHMRASDDKAFRGSQVAIGDRTSITVDGEKVRLESPVIGFTTSENPLYCASIYVGDGLTYFVYYRQHSKVSANQDDFDGVRFIFKSPTVLDNIKRLDSQKEEGTSTVQFCREVYTPTAIDVLFDKLYIIALEKDMLQEAESLLKLRRRPDQKCSRKVLWLLNTVEDYEELIRRLHTYENERDKFPIDEFWKVFHCM